MTAADTDPRTSVAAFAAECRSIVGTLEGIPADAWDRPALGQWTLHELVAHLLRAITRVPAYLDQPVEGNTDAGSLPDRVSYFQMDLAGQAPAIAERARQDAASLDRARVVETFTRATQEALGRIGALPVDHVMQTLRGPMLLEEYLATRVLELVVHHMDVRAALDLPPESDPTAARLTMAILEGLLGGPRPRNLGRTRFILAATGRLEVDDPRFPVLR